MPTPKVLLVDDERSVTTLLSLALRDAGYEVDASNSGQDAVDRLSEEVFDVVITDLRMDHVDGMDVLRATRRRFPAPAVIIMTGHGSIDSAVEAMKLGASDYLTKPVDPNELKIVLERVLEHRQLLSELEFLRGKVERLQLNDLIGTSKPMQQVFQTIQRIARSDVTVLITGESGTGKELVAREIHSRSSRADGPFLTVNCSALTDTLLESELFGHAKGAFTGAISAKKGLFEDADGGTILLDEIGDMEPGAQAALLRVLESGEIRRVGETRPIIADVRVLASTNRNLEKAIEDGTFREDLYYRLRVVPIRIAPLRERTEDILLLALHFVGRYEEKFSRNGFKLSPEAIALLLRYRWPGNVRELQHAIERAILLSDDELIKPEDLPPEIVRPAPEATNTMSMTLEEVEKQHILRRLEECDGNRSEAARQLGVSRNTLARKLKSYGVTNVSDDDEDDE